jgi:hypothetical protein
MSYLSLGRALDIMMVVAGKDISMPDRIMSRERNVKAQYVCVARHGSQEDRTEGECGH